MIELMYGLSNSNRFIRVDLVRYPAPPTNLYIYPKEGWHLLGRSGRLDYKGQAFQDAAFQRQFVALEGADAVSILDVSFSRVEQMYQFLMTQMLKENKDYMKFKTTRYYRKEREHDRRSILYAGE